MKVIPGTGTGKPPFSEFLGVKLNCSHGHSFQEDFGVNDEKEVECPECGEKALVKVVDKKVSIVPLSA